MRERGKRKEKEKKNNNGRMSELRWQKKARFVRIGLVKVRYEFRDMSKFGCR